MSNIKAALPKGFRDFLPIEVAKRKYLSQTIENIFVRYGFLPIETPVMENLSTLTGKYSDEVNKLLFKTLNSGDFLAEIDDAFLAEKKSNQLATKICEKGLRYDLTVPLARYVVQHENELTFPFKRYHIAPVWRADRPQKGRYREFFQCDIDTIGSTSLLNEVECVQVYNAVFEALDLDITILVSSRKILKGIIAEINAQNIENQIITLIDKVDKIGLEQVIVETQKIGLSVTQSQQLKTLLEIKAINQLKATNDLLKEGIAEVNFVLQQNIPNAIFDITLARGADYYTGCIFEVIGKNETFGALGGGGRYDNLTEMFGKKDLTGVGISFGFERIFDLLESLDKYPESLSIAPKLIFLHLGENEKMFAFKLLQSVRNAGISSEIYPDDAKLKKQMNYANDKKIAYTCIIGSTEMENELLTLKNMITGTQQTVTLEELINILQTN